VICLETELLSVVGHVSAISRGISATAVLRPVASRRTHLTNVQWSGSALSKFTFSTSKCYCAMVGLRSFCFDGAAKVWGGNLTTYCSDFKFLIYYLMKRFTFFPSTFVCPTEIIAFSDKANEFHDHFTHLAWINTPRKNGGLGHMNIALLSDLTKQISRDYGVLLEGAGLALSNHTFGLNVFVQMPPEGTLYEQMLKATDALKTYYETHGKIIDNVHNQTKELIQKFEGETHKIKMLVDSGYLQPRDFKYTYDCSFVGFFRKLIHADFACILFLSFFFFFCSL
uniref:Thioredoxin-dependent peroxide reductase, mitochondrial n=1 Tax=Spermophilus dauricus TaxID=99837 RepID=A0A8C9Q3H3_SPEDA